MGTCRKMRKPEGYDSKPPRISTSGSGSVRGTPKKKKPSASESGDEHEQEREQEKERKEKEKERVDGWETEVSEDEGRKVGGSSSKARRHTMGV